MIDHYRAMGFPQAWDQGACPTCGLHYGHVGGTCYGCEGWPWGHFCLWTHLGPGNLSDLLPGFHLAAVAYAPKRLT